MSHTVVWFNKGRVRVSYQCAATAHTQTMCSPQHVLKSPHSLLCSANSDPLFAIPASNYDITFSPFPSPQPVRQWLQAPTAVPKIILRNKGGCVKVFIRWKPETASHSKYFQTYMGEKIDLWNTAKNKNFLWTKAESSLFFCQRELDKKNGWMWMADWGHATDRLLSNTAFTATRWLLIKQLYWQW